MTGTTRNEMHTGGVRRLVSQHRTCTATRRTLMDLLGVEAVVGVCVCVCSVGEKERGREESEHQWTRPEFNDDGPNHKPF